MLPVVPPISVVRVGNSDFNTLRFQMKSHTFYIVKVHLRSPTIRRFHHRRTNRNQRINRILNIANRLRMHCKQLYCYVSIQWAVSFEFLMQILTKLMVRQQHQKDKNYSIYTYSRVTLEPCKQFVHTVLI